MTDLKEKRKERTIYCDCCKLHLGFWSKYAHNKSKRHIKNEELIKYPENEREIMKDLKALVEKMNKKTILLGYQSIPFTLEKIETETI